MDRIPMMMRLSRMPDEQRGEVAACPDCRVRDDGYAILCEKHETDELFRRL